MKNLLLIICLLCINNSFSQSNKKIKTLEYATVEIDVPENCTAQSKYELLACNGISVQWMHLNQETLKSVPGQLIKQYSKETKTKEKIEVISFGSTLKGVRLSYKNPENWDRIIVYGVVNKQPLVLNVASEDELIAVVGLNAFLKKIIKLKS